jgi:pimeloyl-ACP methyl ester carboxylesterase
LLSLQIAPLSAALAATAGRVPGGLVERAAGRIYARLAFHNGEACADEVRAAFGRHYRTAEDVRRITVQSARLVRCLSDGRLLRDAVRLNRPLLVVWGRNDRLVPLADGERLVRAVVDCRLHIVEQCGHCPQLEQPEAFLSAVEPFLRARSQPVAADSPAALPA